MGEMPHDRYYVRKAAGSRYAYVMDSETRGAVQRFDVLRGNGWDKADKLRDRLNAKGQQRDASNAS